jgi:hypothetical protein
MLTMRVRAFLFLLLAWALVACNLGTRQDTSQTITTPNAPSGTLSPSQKPSVTVVSPQSGDRFTVNQPILVSAVAEDRLGITRVQLSANGSIVKTVSSSSVSGDQTLSAVLDFTPRLAGEVTLRVVAFRGTVASDPVERVVTVQEASATLPTALPQPGGNSGSSGNLPVIPNDGVCRVLTNVGLNFRTAPTTTQGNNVITTLAAGTLAPITARLADNSWYEINVNNRLGWVSGSTQFVTITGNCFNVPIKSLETPTPTPTVTPTRTPTPNVTNTPSPPTNTPTPQRPDLVVTGIFGETTVTLGGNASVARTYSVTITNVGLGSSGQFSATLTVNNGTPLELGVVGGLESGQSVTLTREVTFTSAGTYNLRVDADPANQVLEVSEVNNRGDLTVTVNP